MIDLGQLEKLNDLREKGVLTDEEFQAEKQRLLQPDKQQPKKPVYTVVIGLAFVTIAAVVATLLFTAKEGENLPAVLPNALATDVATETVSDAPTIPDEVSQAGSYQWAVSPEAIGLNPAFVERKLGVAKEKSPSVWSFEVGGCEVDYWLKGSEIKSLFTKVTEKCQPNVDGVKITPRTTFLLLMGKAKLFSSCIGGSCGNAADPTIDLLSTGAHYNNFIAIQYEGQYGDVTSKAMDQWVSAIKRQHGANDDDYDSIDVEWFNCISNAPAEVVSTMRRQVVTGIWLGRDLNENCST